MIKLKYLNAYEINKIKSVGKLSTYSEFIILSNLVPKTPSNSNNPIINYNNSTRN